VEPVFRTLFLKGAALRREEEALKIKLAAQAEAEKQMSETGSVFPEILPTENLTAAK